jgi:hypothetical protein
VVQFGQLDLNSCSLNREFASLLHGPALGVNL